MPRIRTGGQACASGRKTRARPHPRDPGAGGAGGSPLPRAAAGAGLGCGVAGASWCATRSSGGQRAVFHGSAGDRRGERPCRGAWRLCAGRLALGKARQAAGGRERAAPGVVRDPQCRRRPRARLEAHCGNLTNRSQWNCSIPGRCCRKSRACPTPMPLRFRRSVTIRPTKPHWSSSWRWNAAGQRSSSGAKRAKARLQGAKTGRSALARARNLLAGGTVGLPTRLTTSKRLTKKNFRCCGRRSPRRRAGWTTCTAICRSPPVKRCNRNTPRRCGRHSKQ